MSIIHPNMINEIMSCQKSIHENIKPGMCATLFVGSDRYACVVIKVKSDKKIYIAHLSTEDYEHNLEIIDNVQYLIPEELEKYDINTAIPYSYRKNHRYMPVGQDMWGTCSIHIGYADNYLDPNF